MYNICVYSATTKRYIHLDCIEAPSREQALESWKEQNPKRLQVLQQIDNLILVALLEGGGI
jgi:hypothetical protein